MHYHHILLIFHLLASTIWIGGHLLLATSYLPKALRQNNKVIIMDFESRYERLGMSSLFVLVVTGIAMAIDFGVYPGRWFHFAEPIERVISVKLLLLFITLLLALSARFFVIPKLKLETGSIKVLAIHIISVTFIGVLMLVLGSSIRFGGL